MRYLRDLSWLFLAMCIVMSACQKKEVTGNTVEYSAGETVLKGYLSYDINAKDKRPGILVLHEWWGQNDLVRNSADMLAAAGYTALAVDMYGSGRVAENQEEAAELARQIMENPPLLKERFMAALSYLKNHASVDPDRIAAIGYSMGGTTVLRMARSGLDLRGVVSFYGGLSATEPETFIPVKAKILVLHGEKDWYVTPHNIAQFKIEMKKTHTDYTLITYKEAKHGFSNPRSDELGTKFNMKLEYNEEADRKSWDDMQNFFKTIFAS